MPTIKKWMTAGIATSCRTTHILLRKWMKSHNPNDEQKYKNYRAVLKRLTTAAQPSYYKEQFDGNANIVKQLWLNLNKIFFVRRRNDRQLLPVSQYLMEFLPTQKIFVTA